MQLADRYVKLPKGVVEDVLVKVDEFYFPADFIILDMELNENAKSTLIILGRPFLATANACINYRTGVMDISFGNKKLRLNIFQATHKHKNEHDLYHIDIIDEVVEEFNNIILDPLETSIF